VVPRVRGFRWSVVWPRLLLLSLALLSALHLASSFAQAEPVEYEPPGEVVTEPPVGELPACPASPGPYEGEDALVDELRANRAEQVEVCEALTARQEQLRDRFWWLTSEAVERLEEPLAVEWEEAQPVQQAGSSVEAEAIAASVDASGEATKEAVWFLAGLAVALFGAYGLYRQVMPRA
jgi:hypothetical protein